MRIILHHEDEDCLIAHIAGEMFNIETGKYWYNQGKKVEESERKPYPAYKSGYVTASIRASYGVLVLPNMNYSSRFLQCIADKLEELSEEHEQRQGFHHLQSYAALETSNDHFNVTRVKNTLKGTKFDADAILSYQRIFSRQFATLDARSRQIGMNRFTWFIFDMDSLIYSIENYPKPTIDSILQLVMIVYDKKGIFKFSNNEFVSHKLSWKDIHITRNFRDVLYLGEVSAKLMTELEARGRKLLVENPTVPTPGIVNPLPSPSPGAVLGREFLDLVKEYVEHHRRPEFILSSHLSCVALILCPIRRAGFEIIRHLGNWEIYQHSSMVNIPLHRITNQIFEDDFRNLSIHNPQPGKCALCNTPLYEDIYVKLDASTTQEGLAYCSICMHATFTINEGKFRHDSQGRCLYTSQDTIIRTRYPVKVVNILLELPVDDLVRDILRACFAKVYWEPLESGSALYLGLNEHDSKLPETYYLAWDGTISNYISEYATPKQKKRRDLTAKFPQLMDQTLFFLAKVLTP
jgi:hypothetical protein